MMLASAAHADFANGSFEDTPAFSGWVTEGHRVPSRIPNFPPTTMADLGLTPNSSYERSDVLAAPGSASATGGVLAWSDQVARVHIENSTGRNYTASSIEQSITLTASDVDTDGRVHVRFTAAPVLEAPNHSADQQPYFFIEITKADGTSLFHTFNFANEAGVPWVSAPGNIQFTDWQAFDVPLDPALVGAGDTITLKAIAAGCGQGGHAGAVYLNNVRTTNNVTGASLWVTANGPAVVQRHTNPDGSTDITYTYTYTNNGSTPVDNVVVDPAMPVDTSGTTTTFVNIGQPSFGGGSCTGPAAGMGSTDPAQCTLGTLQPGESGTFTMTVRVPPGTTADQVNNGTYPIAGTGVPSLLGPLVETDLIADLVPNINSLPPNGGTPGTSYPPNASFSCTNQGSTTASGNTLCHVDNLPPGVTVGQCTVAVPPATPGANWSEGQPVPPAGVVTCPVTGTPTGPAPGPVQGVTGSDNEPNGPAKDNNTVTQSAQSVRTTPVPTLGEWGMMLMAGMLAAVGFGARRRKQG
jgi:hypothetical protein